MIWNLFPFKGDFSFRKSHQCRVLNLGCRGLSHLGDLMFHKKNSAQDVMHEWIHSCDEAASHQFPIATAFWIILIISVEECSSLTQNLMQICCCTCSVISNVTATQYTCSFNGIYRLHWLVQCCTNRSCYINNGWTLPGQAVYFKSF